MTFLGNFTGRGSSLRLSPAFSLAPPHRLRWHNVQWIYWFRQWHRPSSVTEIEKGEWRKIPGKEKEYNCGKWRAICEWDFDKEKIKERNYTGSQCGYFQDFSAEEIILIKSEGALTKSEGFRMTGKERGHRICNICQNSVNVCIQNDHDLTKVFIFYVIRDMK